MRGSNRHADADRRGGLLAVTAAVMGMVLLAGACTRGDDEVQAGGAESGGGADEAPVDEEQSGTGEGDFGDLNEVCGPGDASGATAQGVTDEAIQVGTISDPGFVGRPGLNQELFDATEVFVSWCNEAGGINGRQIEVVERDAKYTEYKQRITEACEEDFMLVGGGGVADDTGQVERITCLLPEVPAYQVSPQSRASELIANPLPRATSTLEIGALNYLSEQFPEATQNVGYMTGTIPSTVYIDAQLQAAGEELGWNTVYETQYNPAGESSWTPFAQALKTEGVQGLVYTGEPENLAALLQAVEDIDYDLEFVLAGSNALDEGFIEIAGDAAQDVYISTSIVPPFMAEENPATAQYQELFEQYIPGGKSDAGLGYNSFSAWLLFAQAVKECGSEVTRSCVFENAKSTDSWNGAGLHAPTNPSEGLPSQCTMIITATPEGFVLAEGFEPTDGLFRCAEENLIFLEGDWGEGVTLESVGKSIDDLE